MPLCGWNDDMSQGLTQFITGSTTQLKEKEMTFCGHNEKMASGIVGVAGGLVLQTQKRANDEGVSITAIPAIEMEEIDALLEELRTSPQRDQLAGVIAIGSLIRHFYAELGKALAMDPSLSVEAVFDTIVAELNRLLFSMEEHYYRDLRPHHSRLVAIRLIRGFLEEQITK